MSSAAQRLGVGSADLRDVSKSEYFDAKWYLETYPDVVELGIDPALHFLWLGARLGRDPSPRFHTDSYLKHNPDVVRAGYNPLLHYLRFGAREGRRVDPVPPPPANIDLSAGKVKTVSRFTGARARSEVHQTVLLVAHLAGEYLFGSERSLLDVAHGLADLGYNVICAVPGTGNPEYIDLLGETSVAVYGFAYGWWNAEAEADELAIATFAALIAQERIDVVHANTVTLDAPLEAALRMGVPRIVHAREIPSEDADLCAKLGTDARSLVAAVNDRTDLLIANSRITAQNFRQPGSPEPSLVYNLVDTAALADVPAVSRSGPLRVGLVSSNIPKKGIHHFVELARLAKQRSDNLDFILIGPRRPEVEAIEEQVRAGTLDANIIVAGYRDSPAEAMAELDVVMSLSTFSESFGRTVVEGMASGRVVIAYAKGAPPELIDHGETGFVIPFENLDQGMEHLLRLEADRDLLLDMGDKARARADARFGPAAFKKALAEAYDRVSQAEIAPRKMVLPARNLPVPRSRESLRVAYFCWHFPVPSETFVLNELRILHEQGIDVRVFCRQSPHPDFEPDFPIEWERVDSPETLARRLLETERDIVHAHFVYPTVTDMVWPACRIADLPFTCIAHAQDIFRYHNAARNRIGEFASDPLCLQVFTLSSFHRNYLIDWGVPVEKITVNPNCVDPELFAGARDADGPHAQTKSILAVSRFSEKKGLEVLIRAGKLLAPQGIQVNIYGYGPLEEAYKRILRDERIDNVRLCGPVKTRDELIALHRSHDLLVVPSVRATDGDMDGIPTTLIEAMASGLPVLSTPVAGIPDLVIDEVTGLMAEEATPERLADRIRDFYEFPPEAIAAMVEDAKKHLDRRFDGRRLVDTLLRFWCGETIDIVLVTWNNLLQTREVLRRLYENTDLPFHLSICDNGSGPEALAHLLSVYAAHENFTLVLNRENAKVGPGTNIAMAEGTSDYVIYVCGKEGMTVQPGWERAFINHLDDNPDVGQAGTLCYSPTYLHGRDYPEALELFPEFRNPEFAKENPDRVFSHIQGGFFAIRRAASDEIGGFSDAVAHSYTDVEFSYAMEAAGWRLGQVDGILALFDKTRPGLAARADETHRAFHPPTLSDLGWLDLMAQRKTKHCNVCERAVEEFDGTEEEQLCPHCGADRRSRSIHRVLSETVLLFRRLAAVGVGLPEGIQPFWKKQFQGLMLDTPDFLDTLQRDGRFPNRAGRMNLAWLNDPLYTEAETDRVLSEVARLLMPEAPLYVSGRVAADEIIATIEPYGFTFIEQTRPSSAVRRFDWTPILKFTRIKTL
jgi:glycosyltransferase involved in cell wall biosynthesis